MANGFLLLRLFPWLYWKQLTIGAFVLTVAIDGDSFMQPGVNPDDEPIVQPVLAYPPKKRLIVQC